jgi:hypothetical protein
MDLFFCFISLFDGQMAEMQIFKNDGSTMYRGREGERRFAIDS